MIPMWTMPVAIGAGNTYILKPSERTPLTSQRLVELLIEAGVPEGVVNVINGPHDAVNGLLAHHGIEVRRGAMIIYSRGPEPAEG